MRAAISIILAATLVTVPVTHVLAQAGQQTHVSLDLCAGRRLRPPGAIRLLLDQIVAELFFRSAAAVTRDILG